MAILHPYLRIMELAAHYGARVMIDEAHATGVIGPNGRGTPEHFGMEGKVDIVAGTLSKGLGVVGGFVASTKEVINYLRFYARSYMFSTAMTPCRRRGFVSGHRCLGDGTTAAGAALVQH